MSDDSEAIAPRPQDRVCWTEASVSEKVRRSGMMTSHTLLLQILESNSGYCSFLAVYDGTPNGC
jgi:hypothetical protein